MLSLFLGGVINQLNASSYSGLTLILMVKISIFQFELIKKAMQGMLI